MSTLESDPVSVGLAELLSVSGALFGDRPPVEDPDLPAPTGAIFYQWPAPSVLPSPKIMGDPKYGAVLKAINAPTDEENPNGRRKAIQEAVMALLNVYSLPDKQAELIRMARPLTPERRSYVQGLVGVSRNFLEQGLANCGLGEQPSYERLYRRIYGNTPAPVSERLRFQMERAFLKAAGASTGSSLAALAHDYRYASQFRSPKTEIPERLLEQLPKLNDYTAREILPHMPNAASLRMTPEAIAIQPDAIVFPDSPNGFHMYLGGETEAGDPAFKSRLSIGLGLSGEADANVGSLFLLIAHEGNPGHHFHAAYLDAATRKRLLPPEAAMGTMYSPSVVLAEGWANLHAWLEPNKEESVHAANSFTYLVQMGLHQFFYDRHCVKRPFEEAKTRAVERFGANPKHVDRWEHFDVHFAAAYGPSYYLGMRATRAAYDQEGLPFVVQNIFTQDGSPMDLRSFKKRSRERGVSI